MKKKKQVGKLFTVPVIISGAIMAFVLFVIIFAPLLAPYDPEAIDMMNVYSGSTAQHWLGTDYMGRDILSRLIIGSRTTLLNAFLVVLISVVIGIPCGMIGGYFGGWFDTIYMRICDIILSFPSLLLAFVLVAVLGRGAMNAIIATGIIYIPMISKLARSLVMTEKSKVYVDACKTMGYSSARIIFFHILPNCVGVLLAELTLDIGVAISSLASLSFVGLGVQAPQSDWGVMLRDQKDIIYMKPLQALSPGIAIVVTITALNVLSDGIQMYLDPQQRRLPTVKEFRKKEKKEARKKMLQAARQLKKAGMPA